MAVTVDLDLGPERPNQNAVGAYATDLFQQHSKMVLGVCRLLLPDPADAEDAMQQAFLSAYRSILAGNQPRQPAAWLATIARNECLDRIRARRREPLARPGDVDDSVGPDALDAVIASADLLALGRSIRELPNQQREALLLHEFCGLSYREVAAVLGVSESAIGSLLFGRVTNCARRCRASTRFYPWLRCGTRSRTCSRAGPRSSSPRCRWSRSSGQGLSRSGCSLAARWQSSATSRRRAGRLRLGLGRWQ
jgi:RNA polymerase sigma-70 factor, ECF subfamily